MDDVTETLLLVLVVVTALAFDFTNGFHDTGNAMATSIATKPLKPKTALAGSAGAPAGPVAAGVPAAVVAAAVRRSGTGRDDEAHL